MALLPLPFPPVHNNRHNITNHRQRVPLHEAAGNSDRLSDMAVGWGGGGGSHKIRLSGKCHAQLKVRHDLVITIQQAPLGSRLSLPSLIMLIHIFGSRLGHSLSPRRKFACIFYFIMFACTLIFHYYSEVF